MAEPEIMTEPTGTYNLDGSYVIIPHTMPGGRPLSKDDAIAQYHRTGKHLGKFETPEAANAHARQSQPELAAAITKGLKAVKAKIPAKAAEPAKAPIAASEVAQRLKGSKPRMEPKHQNIHIHVNLGPEIMGRLLRGKK